ncbi:MAG: 3'-5' exonuclease [Betaproteobacteria bacterium RIFCSPLOWO2_12_FULL_62_13]|nr:MAG: 3'-5' exonuclease [Betaproteobacteria bacterium RIFCSPLOWO2_12_FULL_62_13]
MTPVLAFDIETVPDIEGLRRLHGLDRGISDSSVAQMAFQLRRQATGGDFLPLHLHRVIVISCAMRERDSFRVWSLGGANDTESELIQRFFDGIQKYTPQLVSWNGGGFDFPVLHYRGLIHGVKAPRYWDMGEGDHRDSRDFRWNNYISRYHTRHLDLMDLLALYQPRANAPLDEFAKLIGLPGKLGMEGAGVWDAFQAGRIAEIRNYCEVDAANTYLVFLRFQLMRGVLSDQQHAAECDLVRATLGKLHEPHWKEFLERWRP